MQEETDSDLMHLNGFEKGERFANEAPEALAQRVVETLPVIRGALGINGPMPSGRQDVGFALSPLPYSPALRAALGNCARTLGTDNAACRSPSCRACRFARCHNDNRS